MVWYLAVFAKSRIEKSETVSITSPSTGVLKSTCLSRFIEKDRTLPLWSTKLRHKITVECRESITLAD